MTSEPGFDHPWEQSEAEVALIGRGISVSSRVDRVEDGVVLARPTLNDSAPRIVVRVGDPVEVFWKSQGTKRMVPAEVVEVGDGAVARWRMRMTGPAEATTQRRSAVRGNVILPVEATFRAADIEKDTAGPQSATSGPGSDTSAAAPEGAESVTAVPDVDAAVPDAAVPDADTAVPEVDTDGVEGGAVAAKGRTLTLAGGTVDLSETGMRALFVGEGRAPQANTPVVLTFEVDDGPVVAHAAVVRSQAEGKRWLLSLRFVKITEKDQDRVRRRVFRVLREERARWSE